MFVNLYSTRPFKRNVCFDMTRSFPSKFSASTNMATIQYKKELTRETYKLSKSSQRALKELSKSSPKSSQRGRKLTRENI